jgi:hypothetical protein
VFIALSHNSIGRVRNSCFIHHQSGLYDYTEKSSSTSHRTPTPLCIHGQACLHLVQVGCDVGELALLELGLPEDGVGVVEAVLDPALLLDVVQVDVTT